MTTKTIEAALVYAGRGWPVFPCRPDKTPLTEHGALDASTDPERIRAWWMAWPMANIAIDVGGAGMMVLDLDPGHDMRELEASVGPLPPTQMQASTPRGGTHLFYALEEGEIVPPSVAKLAAHVDVRSFHSYVLVWPSRTHDGEYQWGCDPATVKPAFRSDRMAEVAKASSRMKSRDRDEWIIKPDLPENVAKAVRWLKEDAKIAVEGAGGDATAYATAAYMKSLGISEPLAGQIMWENWNPRCDPPWTADEWEHFEAKIRNAYAYNTSPPGNLTEAYRAERLAREFQPKATVVRGEDGTASGRELQSGRFRIVDREGAGQARPVSWLIEDAIPERSFAMLFGPPGSYKSFVAVDIAMSVAVGPSFPWSGVWTSALSGPGTVLYCAGEGRSQMVSRLRAWEKLHNGGAKVDGIFLADPVPHVGNPEEIDHFIQLALAMNPDGYDLVVVDTVGRAMMGLNENAQEHASKFSNLVERLQYGLLDAAVLAIHHSGHDHADRARGSSVFLADADTMLRVERPDADKAQAYVHMVKQKDASEWEQPIVVEARSVILDERTNASSLAMAGPQAAAQAGPTMGSRDPKPERQTAKEIFQRRSTGRSRNQNTVDKEADAVIDSAIETILSENKLKAWSTRGLVTALNHGHGDLYSEEAIRKRVLPRLLADKTSAAHRFFDPATGRYRYAE